MDKAEYVFYKLAQQVVQNTNDDIKPKIFNGESRNFDGITVRPSGWIDLHKPTNEKFRVEGDYVTVIPEGMTRKEFLPAVNKINRLSDKLNDYDFSNWYTNYSRNNEFEKKKQEAASTYVLNKKINPNSPELGGYKHIIDQEGYSIGTTIPYGSDAYNRVEDYAKKNKLFLNKKRNPETGHWDIITRNNSGNQSSQNFA